MLELALEKRITFGKKLASARKGGKLPVVVYGSKHKSSSYFVDGKAFKKIWKDAGESTLVSLTEGKKNYDVLIQDVSVHPISDEPLHVDFYAIDVNKPVEVKVALEFAGISPAVKNLSALLVKVMHEIEIKVLPKNLVHEISVDISKLENFGDKIHASDVVLPPSAELLTTPTEVVVMVTEPREEKEEEVAPVDLTAIEVEKKGKVEKDGEAVSEGTSEKPEKSDKKEEKK